MKDRKVWPTNKFDWRLTLHRHSSQRQNHPIWIEQFLWTIMILYLRQILQIIEFKVQFPYKTGNDVVTSRTPFSYRHPRYVAHMPHRCIHHCTHEARQWPAGPWERHCTPKDGTDVSATPVTSLGPWSSHWTWVIWNCFIQYLKTINAYAVSKLPYISCTTRYITMTLVMDAYAIVCTPPIQNTLGTYEKIK